MSAAARWANRTDGHFRRTDQKNQVPAAMVRTTSHASTSAAEGQAIMWGKSSARARVLRPAAGGGREGVFPPGHEKRAAPAIRVLGQLQVVRLAVHARHEVADPAPGVEPLVEPLKHRRHVGGDARERGEAERCKHQRGPLSVVSASLCARMFLGHSIT